MKKILMVLVLSMFLISFASASLFQSNQVFTKNSLTLHQRTFLEHYSPHRIKHFRNFGTYEIHKSKLIGLLRGATTQKYTLLDSSNSIINAYAILDVENYGPNRLLSKMSFEGGTPRDLKIFYWVNESYYQNKPIYKKVCSFEKTNMTNSKRFQRVCKQIKIRTEKVKKYKTYWKDYKNQVMPIGDYKIKITAKLPRANKKVDWILHTGAQDIPLSNWLWWNSNWAYKKQIAVTETSGTTLTDYSVLLHITYSSNMNSDFSDLRFTNSAEDTELGYLIENYTASTDAYVWVKIPTLTASSVTNIYMYYGNSGVTTTSNIGSAFLFGDDFGISSLKEDRIKSQYYFKYSSKEILRKNYSQVKLFFVKFKGTIETLKEEDIESYRKKIEELLK